jgi:Cu+-exporting ATPase
VSDFEARPGRGVRGVVEGKRVWIGSPAAAEELGADPEEVRELARAFANRGQTPVLVLVDDQLIAGLGFADEIRHTSREAVKRLEALGLEPELYSGDHPGAVEQVARELGIGRVKSQLLPEQKAEALRKLQAEGHSVVMVGDGINDAPALAVADVGVAMGGGADVAIEAADCAVLQDDPLALARLVTLARATMATIRQNLVWAFGYNVVALPLAAGALAPWTGWSIPAHWAAAAMAGSSLFVVTNSLRLGWTSLAPRS